MTKLPMIERPIFNDPDLCRVLESRLEPYSGKSLERRQAALRKVAGSGVIGSFDQLVTKYSQAMDEADPPGKGG